MESYPFSQARASNLLKAVLVFQEINTKEYDSAADWPVTPGIDGEVWSLTDRRYGDADGPDEIDLAQSDFQWWLEHGLGEDER